MHWRAVRLFGALVLLLLPRSSLAQSNDVPASTTTLPLPSDAGFSSPLAPTDLPLAYAHDLAAATPKTGDENGQPLTTSSASTSSAKITVHKPQVITTAVGTHLRGTATTNHTKTVTANNSTFTFVFSPHTHPLPSPRPTDPSSSSTAPPAAPSSHPHQSTTAIVLEVLGGLALLFILFFCGRCCYRYRRTPGVDRIAVVVDRHLLERELAAMEEARPIRQRASIVRVPPPPYQRAPDYEDVVRETSREPP